MNKRKKKYSKNYRKTKKVRSSTNVRRRRYTKKNSFMDILARYLRLILLVGLSALLIYFLFKSGDKSDTTAPVGADTTLAEETEKPEEIIPEEPTVNLDELPVPERLDFHLNKIFENFNIKSSWVKRKGSQVRVNLPSDLPAIEVIVEIIQLVNEMDLSYFTRENLAKNISQILIADKNDTLRNLIFIPSDNLVRKMNRMAIIIDDFGYYQDEVSDLFLNLKFPITLSIIPGQKYSRVIMKKARVIGKEVMIHLPMEPMAGKVENNGFTIMTSMSEDEIADCIQKAVEEISDAVAVNNHMGSKATEDVRVMNVVCRELKRYNLMFVDSRTTSRTVAEKSARRFGLPYLRRMIFLETKDNRKEDFIEKQFQKAVALAKRNGYVVVIGHPYKETMHVLQRQLPMLESLGIELVPISQLKNAVNLTDD